MNNSIKTKLATASRVLKSINLHGEASAIEKLASPTDQNLSELIELIELVERYTPWATHRYGDLTWKRNGFLEGGTIMVCGHRLTFILSMLKKDFIMNKVPEDKREEFQRVAETINIPGFKEVFYVVWQYLRLNMNVDITRGVENDVWEKIKMVVPRDELASICSQIPTLNDVMGEAFESVGDFVGDSLGSIGGTLQGALGILETDSETGISPLTRPSNNPLIELRKKKLRDVGKEYLDENGDIKSFIPPSPSDACPHGTCYSWSALDYEVLEYEEQLFEQLELARLQEDGLDDEFSTRLRTIGPKLITFIANKEAEQIAIRERLESE